MTLNDSPTDLFAGVDNLSLDKRSFGPSRDDIESICRFFSVGKLQHYEKEKNIIVSHSNFFVFVATTQGQYALKFYPVNAAPTITIEYAINRILTGHQFLTPLMYAGPKAQAFMASNGRLAACYSYIDGLPAWQHIQQRKTIQQINTALFSLKNILSTAKKNIPFPKQESLAAMINRLAQDSCSLAPYDQKETIDASLRDTYQTYQQHHQLLFTRQNLHNNSNLTNFLVSKKTVYTLDLSHIREDYAFSDLASLVISCLFFNIPVKTIKTIVQDHFIQHKIKTKDSPVLNTLVKVGLIKEYLKNIRRERSVGLSTYPPDLVRTYMSHSSARKRSITAILRKQTCY
jgi:hypothetical protein